MGLHRRGFLVLIAISVALVGAMAWSSCNYGGTSTSGPVTVSGYSADVTMHDISFDPSDLTISQGTTVTWTNNDSVTHTVTEDNGLFDQRVDPGKTFSYTFAQPGTYSYHCSIHSNMTAKVTVR